MPNSPFLNNFIRSLSTKQQQSVASLFQLAVDSKSDIQQLINQLGNFNLDTFIPVNQPAAGRISGNDWFLNFRSLNLLLASYFTTVNQIGLLLDTNQKILFSQLAAAEKQLSILEKQITNFEFLLGTGNTYNYAYTETFHDILGQDMNPSWPISDRDGLGFNLDFQQNTVLTNAGTLLLPQDTLGSASLIAELISSNASSFVISNIGLNNILSNTSPIGWDYIISSPNPVTSSIDPIFGNNVGVQVILEFTLSEPTSCSQIQITPIASESIEIIDILAYSASSDTIGFSIVGSQNININQTFVLSFPLTTIQRFRLYLNQPTYNRVLTNQNPVEDQYNKIYAQSGALEKSVDNLGYDNISFAALSETINSLPNFASTGLDSFNEDIADILRVFKTKIGPQTQWCRSSQSNDSLIHLYSQIPRVFKTIFNSSTNIPQLKTASSNIDQLSAITNNNPSPIMAMPSGKINQNISPQYNYQYNIGLQSVSIGINIPEYKGIFISNIIPSPGDMGIVVLDATDNNYIDSNNNLDNPILTSIEYSITNISSPSRELDWQPILPLSNIVIDSERLFPNASNACLLRFVANSSEPLYIYRNGYNYTNYSQLLDSTNNNVIGISLAAKTYSPQDIMTISYTPIASSNRIDFTKGGFADLPLLSASNTDGAGEGFSSTIGNNIVQLSHIPFIDSTKIGFTTYQPINVVLNDGTVLINSTNYQTGAQPPFPLSGYYYIQSNNILMFNQAISQPFRVYYQYLQNNTRFRVVLRSNSINVVSPSVNLVQIKSETRFPNAVQVI